MTVMPKSSANAQTHWVNMVLMWIYMAFLMLQFVLALGNRPKGEKGLYILTMMCVSLLSLAYIDDRQSLGGRAASPAVS